MKSTIDMHECKFSVVDRLSNRCTHAKHIETLSSWWSKQLDMVKETKKILSLVA